MRPKVYSKRVSKKETSKRPSWGVLAKTILQEVRVIIVIIIEK